MSTPFWLKDPSILVNIHSQNIVNSFWPNETMNKNEKFNAITRLLLVIIVVFYISNGSIKFLCMGCTTLFMITLVYFVHVKDTETFINISSCKKETTKTNTDNPMANLLLPEIKDNPEKKPSEKTYGIEQTIQIEDNVKDMTCKLSFENEDSDEIKKKLFSNVGEQLLLDRSMTQFYTTSNNEVPNDRESFQEYLYGNMPSCKDQDSIACLKRNFRHVPHT